MSIRKPCIYLKFDGIKGYSKARGFKGRIMCHTANFQIFKLAPKGGDFRAGGQAIVGPLQFTKLQDAASNDLYKEACEGKPKNTTFDVTKRSLGFPVGTVQLAAVNSTITNYTVKIHGATPVENYAMVFASLGLTVNILKKDGSQKSRKYYQFNNNNYELGAG